MKFETPIKFDILQREEEFTNFFERQNLMDLFNND